MSVLHARGVTYAYPDAAGPALQGLDLDVGEGELVVLAGASASGKSTLLRAAAGLVPHFHGGTFGGRMVVGGLDTRPTARPSSRPSPARSSRTPRRRSC